MRHLTQCEISQIAGGCSSCGIQKQKEANDGYNFSNIISGTVSGGIIGAFLFTNTLVGAGIGAGIGGGIATLFMVAKVLDSIYFPAPIVVTSTVEPVPALATA